MRLHYRLPSSRSLAILMLCLLGAAAGVACEDDPDDLDYLRAGTGGQAQTAGRAGGAEAGSGGAAGASEADAG